MKICYFFGHSFIKNNDNLRRRYDNFVCKHCKEYYVEEEKFFSKYKWSETFWNSATWDIIKIIGIFVLIIAAFLLLVAAIMSITTYNTCQQYSKLGIDTIWNFWTGCLAKHPEFGYIPVDEYFKTFNIYKP